MFFIAIITNTHTPHSSINNMYSMYSVECIHDYFYEDVIMSNTDAGMPLQKCLCIPDTLVPKHFI